MIPSDNDTVNTPPESENVPQDSVTEPVQATDSRGGDVLAYEIEFKGGRRDCFLCTDHVPVKPLDFLIVQADRGEHIGRFIRFTDKEKMENTKDMKSVLRRATYTDIQIMMDNKHKEDESFMVCKGKIEKHGLKMKLVDVEYQFDGNKICFYFTADKRIDFRELVKDLAAEYRTRIELRQIGVRDEARRLGGLGVCGRPLCCKTFLCEFEPITSQMARDQNLSLSPSKISGLCGRLMCCLAYEEEFYRQQNGLMPDEGAILEKDGKQYSVVKVDIFAEEFTLRDENKDDMTVGIDQYQSYKIVRPGRKNNDRCSSECNACYAEKDKNGRDKRQSDDEKRYE